MATVHVHAQYLNDVEDGDVAVVVVSVAWSGHHHILWLEKSAHDIQYCCLTYTGSLEGGKGGGGRGGRKGGREGGREGREGREGGREGEEGRKGGREGGREGGRDEGKEEKKERRKVVRDTHPVRWKPRKGKEMLSGRDTTDRCIGVSVETLTCVSVVSGVYPVIK